MLSRRRRGVWAAVSCLKPAGRLAWPPSWRACLPALRCCAAHCPQSWACLLRVARRIMPVRCIYTAPRCVISAGATAVSLKGMLTACECASVHAAAAMVLSGHACRTAFAAFLNVGFGNRVARARPRRPFQPLGIRLHDSRHVSVTCKLPLHNPPFSMSCHTDAVQLSMLLLGHQIPGSRSTSPAAVLRGPARWHLALTARRAALALILHPPQSGAIVQLPHVCAADGSAQGSVLCAPAALGQTPAASS